MIPPLPPPPQTYPELCMCVCLVLHAVSFLISLFVSVSAGENISHQNKSTNKRWASLLCDLVSVLASLDFPQKMAKKVANGQIEEKDLMVRAVDMTL